MTRAIRSAFVTGATGFVGANLVRALRREGVAVKAFARGGSDRSSLAGVSLEWREGELHDPEALAQGLEGCDACFHVAAALSAPRPADLYRTNVEGTRAVLEVAARAGCTSIVHTSTMGTLWRPDGGAVRETDSRLAPGASEYVKSKLEGEEIARGLAERGAPVVIVHPSAPVGAWDRVPTVSGRRIVDVLEGRLPRWIPGTINHIAATDVAQGMILAAKNGEIGKHYLLAHAEGNLTRDAFVSLVARAAGIAAPRERRRFPLLDWLRGKRRAGATPSPGPSSLACDPVWTVKALGLPQTSLETAFMEAVAWFRSR